MKKGVDIMKSRYIIGFFAVFLLAGIILTAGYQFTYDKVMERQAAQAQEASQPALSLTESSEDGGGQTDVAVDSGEDAALERLSLRQAVQELAPRDRNIVYLRYCKSSTQTETARRLGMTQVQVSRREKVILQQLRLKLAE